MTDREKAIVMAYTGYCMLAGDKLSVFYEYVESIMGRPVYTHEMAIKAIDDEIKEKSKADFKALCADESSSEEPCTDAISREDALMALTGEYMDSPIEILPKAIKRINALSPVKPAEKVGQWIEHFDESGKWYECDQCHTDWGGSVNYCPNCGSKM